MHAESVRIRWARSSPKYTRGHAAICHPRLAAVQAYLLFHETLSPVQFVGFTLALVGVLLARSARTAPR
jgi:drug/metabolite transporter (DMT)-like permease